MPGFDNIVIPGRGGGHIKTRPAEIIISPKCVPQEMKANES